MMRTNKRGQLAILTVIALIAVITVILVAQREPYRLTVQIGERQQATLNIFAEAQFTRDYMDSAAELALRTSAEEWGTKSGEGISFESLVVQHFEKYLRAYPSDLNLPASEVSLFASLSFEYVVETEPLSFKALPRTEFIEDVPIVLSNGAVIFIDIDVPTVIEYIDEKNGVKYTASAYAEADLGGKNLEEFLEN